MMAEESEVQPVNKTYNTIEPQVNYMEVLEGKNPGCFGYSNILYLILGEQFLFPEMQVETKRIPRRVLHFSDGVIEEFSTDDEAEREEEEQRQKEANQQVFYPSLFMKCLVEFNSI